MKTKSIFLKTVAVFLLVTMISEVVFPSMAYALTDGPVAPEFSDFEPVASTDMVNNFTGDFSYNLPVIQIPGPEGSGYSMSLSYHSGVSSEEEASWVGHGWTLNPGSISRGVKGIPDDYNGDNITNYNKTRVNWTATAQKKYNLETKSEDKGNFGLSVNFGKTYSNYSGMSKMWGLNLSGSNGDMSGSIGVQFSGRDPIFSLSVQPAEKLETSSKSFSKAVNKVKKKLKLDKTLKSKSKLVKKLLTHKDKKGSSMKLKVQKPNLINALVSAAYGMYTNSQANKLLTVTENHGFQFNFVNTNALWAYIPVGFEEGFNGTVMANANIPESTMPAYGYLHNFDPSVDSYISDYHVEKSNNYNRRMKYLGIPFSSPDNFMVSGEGVNGGFRLYADKPGHYHANQVNSRTKIYNGGPAKGIGLPIEVSIGTQLLGGHTDLTSHKTWHDDDGALGGFKFPSDKNNPNYFFRFQNDLGGSVEYGSVTDVASATIAGAQDINFVPGTRKMAPDFSGLGLYASVNNGQKVGRSSYIKPVLSSSSKFNGFEITNDNGAHYYYTYPMNVRNEASIQVKASDSGDGYLSYKKVFTDDAVNNKPTTADNDYITGEYKGVQYTSSYLLRCIKTPDYVDLGTAGMDNSDLGGWTKLEYRQKYGNASGNWYRWRSPYVGLHYEQNTISSLDDDAANVAYGDKEVSYLGTIETKTHIAYFVTNKSTAAAFGVAALAKYLDGSQLTRKDGWGAKKDEEDASNPATPRTGANVLGTEECEMLERIVLFAKDNSGMPTGRPLQTTYFKYNYSLSRNLLNSSATGTSYTESGKLTLERVWMESEDVVNTRVSPYIFKYEYKTPAAYAPEIQSNSLYSNILNYVTPFAGSAMENPDYLPQSLDRWGHNQYNGAQRFKEGKEWNYQGAYSASVPYDPAAWQLKQIILPSGGEIHIQYEEKDYQYVQDKRAMGFVSLDPATQDRYDASNLFYLNLNDVGVTTPADVAAQRDLLVAEFTKNPYIYFKFLYALKGSNPALDNCKSEYIDGYVLVDVNSITVDGSNRISFSLGEDQSCIAFNEEERAIPKQVCYAYLTTQRGSLVENDACTPSISKLSSFDDDMAHLYQTSTDVKNDFHDYGSRTGGHRDNMRDLIKDLKDGDYDTPSFSDVKNNQGEYCMALNFALSYLRIPMLKAKRGDGVRVKRLLMYDKGLETGDASLYGSEYFYQNEDGTSSGVATNEPAAGREENALVYLLERYKQTFMSRVVSGRNKLEFEGPVGESLLPAASVGHSRVVVRNIYTGQTGGGFVEYTYHTANEYPISQDYVFSTTTSGNDLNNVRAVDKTSIQDNRKRDYLPLPLGLINLTINKEWAAQGYNFILYNIHGQPKAISTYGGGVYDATVAFNSAKYPLISQTKYEFFEPGEKLKMLLPSGDYYMDTPGKEMDITMEMRSIREKTFNPSLDFDVAVAIYAPEVSVNFGFGLSYTDALTNTHVTSKVINYPVIQKRIITMKDGVTSVSENLAFSPETGKPLLTKTCDSYDKLLLAKANGGTSAGTQDGSYYNLVVPASWIYNSLGRKFIDTTYANELGLTAASITTYGLNADPTLGGASVSRPDPVTAIAHGFNGKSYTNVISASANTYAPYTFGTSDALLNAEYNISSYSSAALTQLNTLFRPLASYIYKTDRTVSDNLPTGSPDQNRTYNSGYYNSFNMLNFSTPTSNANWLRTSTVTKYSPHGKAIEEADIMNLYSAVRFGYNNTMPVMTAKNATYGSIAFRGFEDETSGTTTTAAHSGTHSTQLTTSSACILFGPSSPYLLSGDNAPYTRGALLKVWVKEVTPGTTATITAGMGTSISSLIWSATMTQVAQTGDWKLFQIEIPESTLTSVSSSMYTYQVGIITSTNVFVDDARFEPYQSESNCYVYDDRLRVVTSFDDQHFGVYYQYDQEGKLLRKKIETEKGIMTVQENLQNTPRVK
jgi:YD repeat-containing protein